MGGVATYQAHQISYLISIGKTVILLDDSPDNTLSKLNMGLIKKKYVSVINYSAWDDPKGTSKIIKDNAKVFHKIAVIINNPSLLIKYFPFFLFIRWNKKYLTILTLHSKMIFKCEKLNYFGEFIVSIISFFLVEKINFVSKFIRDYWENNYPWLTICNSRTVNNGIIISHDIKIKASSGNLKIGFVGRFAIDKNPVLFLDIADLAQKKQLNYNFYMYGDGALNSYLRKNAPANTFIYNWTDADKIYSNLDLLIITSPIETSSYVMLEAKNYGIPTITGANGGILDLIEHGRDGIVVPNLTPKNFVDAIQLVSSSYYFFSKNCLINRLKYSALEMSQQLWFEIT